MVIRKGNIEDSAELQQLAADTVKSICKHDYTPDQLIAWIFGIKNTERWNDVLTNQLAFVAQEQGLIIGFGTLDSQGYIDLLYVHKNYQRKGIALQLYSEIENEARRQGVVQLVSDVSITARPFFETVGFGVLRQQKANLNGVELINYRMVKNLKE